MKYVIDKTTLTAIGDAVRAKGNTEDKILVSNLATAISNLPTGGGGDIEVEPIELTGAQAYGCAGELASCFIKLYGDKVSTKELADVSYMFYYSTVEFIPFSLNMGSVTDRNCVYLFANSYYLKSAPECNNFYPSSLNYLFKDCYRLREIPEEFGDNWNWSSVNTGSMSNCSSIFANCYSLRRVPQSFLKHLWGIQTTSYTPTYNLFNECYSLDEVRNLPIQQGNQTSNMFNNTITNCHRLKSLIFITNEDGTPKTASWKSQTIDLSRYVGYSTTTTSRITNYNSGITLDKRVVSTNDYQALKNDPDWWSDQIGFSRYNHDSAVETINSLPDCSATGTNTIKFKGASGSATDGGAINTLTEAEIAVAAAKGWTVTLT